jgi:polar amino acid transport system substrate-binding protein
MHQVAQYQKDGEIQVLDIQIPICMDNGVLVKTAYSIISAGTEKTSVNNAKGSLLSRAKKQPDQVKLVLDTIKKQGLKNTIFRVQNKLNSYKQIGYSLSGIVVESKCNEFQPGDRVACGGAGYANHAEFVSIPKNLVVKIPDNVNYIDAAYTTIVSIAMQGVRQADVRLGENVAVIGLGLLGQITARLLKASGCNVIGLDINEELFEEAKKSGCSLVVKSNSESVNQIKAFTAGVGCDAVIITAGTSSDAPLNLSMNICRQRGNVVIVGAIGMNLKRNPFYTKEINLKISCSYGPGRYDPNYEELGQDYPIGYVRWTENRNMLSFINLLSNKNINVDDFTTHIIPIKEANKAYKIITGEIKEKFIGIAIDFGLKENFDLLEFSKTKDLNKTNINKTNQANNLAKSLNQINVGFIGAGQFASNYILPNLLDNKSVNLLDVANNTPISTASSAKQFGFKNQISNISELINNQNTNLIFCATRHDKHAEVVIKSIENGKYVFVEKPLVVNLKELEQVIKSGAKNNSLNKIMVGFNRRFSNPFKDIKSFFRQRTEPMVVSYRVNAGFIPKNHWTQQIEQGERIIGEGCHFFDTMIFLIESLPIRVYAESISISSTEKTSSDNVMVIIKFSDGSIGKLEYLANGDSSVPKEYCEVFCQNKVAIMDNFTTLKLFTNGNLKEKKYNGEKGIINEINETLNSVNNQSDMPISFNEIKYATLISLAVGDSIKKAQPININEMLS